MQINSLLSGAVSGGYYDYFSSPNSGNSPKMDSASENKSTNKMTETNATNMVSPSQGINTPITGTTSTQSTINVTDTASFSPEGMAYYGVNNANTFGTMPSDSFQNSFVQQPQQPQPSSTTPTTYSPETVRGVMASNMTGADTYTEAASGVAGEEMMAGLSSELALRLGAGMRMNAANPTDTEQRPTTTEAYGMKSMSANKGYADAATKSFINTYA